MNITISPINNRNYQSNKLNPQNNSNRNNPMLSSGKHFGLSADTVSFGVGVKVMGSRTDAVNIQLAKRIHEEAKPAMNDLQKVLKKYLGSLIATESNPDRPILAKNGIVTRIKTEESICEKTAARGLRSKDEIKEDIGDIIGARIVLRDASEAGVNEIMKRLTDAVKTNELKIFEIENYSPSPKYSYVSKKPLDILEKTCNKIRSNGVRRSENSIPSGYTALHFGVYLPNGYMGEIQLMGVDVQKVKEIEDLIYKVKNNKSLDKKYKVIEDKLSSLKEVIFDKNTDNFGPNKQLHRAVNAHSMEQYIAARTLEPKPLKAKKNVKFLPVPNYLPPEFDYNLLHKMKIQCDRAV